MTKDIYEITIVGAGPAGLFAAFYAGMRKAKTKIIDSLPQLGGQLAMLYPEKHIYDTPGFPNIKAADLVANLEKQIEPFKHTICLEEEVLDLTRVEDYWELTTNQGTHYTKAVIIAAGNGSFQPRRLALPEADSLEGRDLHYYVPSLEAFRGKQVAIAGGGDSAIDWALMLEDIAASVAIIHRRSQFRGHEHSVEKLQASGVNILTPFVVKELTVTDDQLTGLVLQEVKTGNEEILPVDSLIVNYGFTSSLDQLKGWGLEISRNAIEVKSDMSTNLPGVYAIGDICRYVGKVKLIATGFGEAPTAINNALHFIDPENRTQPMHSSSLFG